RNGTLHQAFLPSRWRPGRSIDLEVNRLDVARRLLFPDLMRLAVTGLLAKDHFSINPRHPRSGDGWRIGLCHTYPQAAGCLMPMARPLPFKTGASPNGISRCPSASFARFFSDL